MWYGLVLKCVKIILCLNYHNHLHPTLPPSQFLMPATWICHSTSVALPSSAHLARRGIQHYYVCSHSPIPTNWQVWRLVTCFLFFGQIGFSFLFNMIFLYRFCRKLEETHYAGKTASFIILLMFGASLTLVRTLTYDLHV